MCEETTRPLRRHFLSFHYAPVGVWASLDVLQRPFSTTAILARLSWCSNSVSCCSRACLCHDKWNRTRLINSTCLSVISCQCGRCEKGLMFRLMMTCSWTSFLCPQEIWIFIPVCRCMFGFLLLPCTWYILLVLDQCRLLIRISSLQWPKTFTLCFMHTKSTKSVCFCLFVNWCTRRQTTFCDILFFF